MKTKTKDELLIVLGNEEFNGYWIFIKSIVIRLIKKFGDNWPEICELEITKEESEKLSQSISAGQVLKNTLRSVGIQPNDLFVSNSNTENKLIIKIDFKN